MPAAVPAGPVRNDRTAVRTRQRHAAIHQMLVEGRSVRAIGFELGLARNTPRLWQEIRARGYPGGYSLVREHLAPLRGTAIAPPRAPVPPKPRKVTAWIMTRS